MENMETILDELNEYERTKTAEIPKPLEDYILHLAKTGETLFPWPKIRWLIRRKLECVVADFRQACPVEGLAPSPNVDPFHYETMRDKILEQFDSFTCAPFTIQRLCELLCAPRKHYKRTDKFMRGIEKNLLVVSTVDPEQSSRKRLASMSSSQTLMNGVVEVNRNATATSLPISTFGMNQVGDQQPQQHRPASAASDVASVSDADSGISDTEDEEKQPAAAAAAAAALSAVENEKSEARNQEESGADVARPSTSESVPQGEPPAVTENATTEPTLTEAAGEPAPTPAEGQQATVCEPVDQQQPTLSTDGEAQEPSRIASPSPAVEEMAESQVALQPAQHEQTTLTASSDKKRPLERDEDGDREGLEDQSPEAKQARFFSPDKTEDQTASTALPTEPEAPQPACEADPAIESTVNGATADTSEPLQPSVPEEVGTIRADPSAPHPPEAVN